MSLCFAFLSPASQTRTLCVHLVQVHPSGSEVQQQHHEHGLRWTERSSRHVSGTRAGACAHRSSSQRRPGDQPHLTVWDTISAASSEVQAVYIYVQLHIYCFILVSFWFWNFNLIVCVFVRVRALVLRFKFNSFLFFTEILTNLF